MTQTPLTTSPDYAMLLVLLVAVILIPSVVHLLLQGKWKHVLMGGGALVLILGLFSFAPVANRSQPDSSNSTFAPSLDEEWERLTESKIELDDDIDLADGETATTDPQPDWLDTKPKRVGNVYRVTVASEPFVTTQECYRQLESKFRTEVVVRLTALVPKGQRSAILQSSDDLGISLAYIMREICREEYEEAIETSVGWMRKVHVLMEFTPAVEEELLAKWVTHQRRGGLFVISKVAGVVLLSLAGFFGALQLDTWTRGYYSKRLLVGVPAAIIAVVALALFA